MAVFLMFIYLLPSLIALGFAIWYFVFIFKNHRQITKDVYRILENKD